MAASNTSNTYGSVTKFFHWTTAVLIIALIPLGAVANRLPYETNAELALKAQVFSIHKTLGVLVFFVALARILWALTQPKPGHLHPDRKVETWAAETAHWVLYASLVIVPLTGWIEHAATTGFAPIWWPFGQGLPFVPKDVGLAHTFAALHWIFGKVMVVTLLLHVAGALKHHVIDRDATLKRMWFGRTTAVATPHRTRLVTPVLAAASVLGLSVAAGAAAGFFEQKDAISTTALAETSSEWAVQSGEIAITVTQFGSPVRGTFDTWTSAIAFDPAPADIMGSVTTTIAIDSLSLGSVTAQAMGADFFDQAQFPTAVFAADIKPNGDTFIADGTLTLKGVEVPVTLPFTLNIDGDTATMTGATTLQRLDFNVGASMADETNLKFAVDVAIALTATRE